jgi:hypothetical protein
VPNQPKDTPIIQKPTPIVLDELLIEQTDSNKALYDRMFEYGHYHPNRQKYPTYRFLKAEPTDYGGMRYYWANDFNGQDAYNASKTYLMESNAHPIFTRSYRVLRSDYLANGPSAALSAFTGLVTVKVTAGGTGYTHDFAVTFSGGGGSGGAGLALVDTATGAVIYIALTNVGSGYTSAPTVVLSAGDGTGATATAYIQPTNALLVSEKHSKLDDADPYNSLYDRLVMQWMTLPGPILLGAQTDKTSGIKANYQKQLVASGTVTGGTSGAGLLSLRIVSAGSGFTAGTYNLGITGGGGTGATGTYTVSAPSPAGKIGSVALTSAGSGYTSLPTASISGGGGSGATVGVVLNGKPIASVALTSSDANFIGTPTVTISDAASTGSGATAIAPLTPTSVDTAAVVAGGSGYSGGATATITGGGGTGATASVTVVAGVVTAVAITAAGSGYTSTPTIAINDVSGTGAVVTLNLVATSIASLVLTSTGNFYQSPTVTITGMGTATGSALIVPTSVQSLTLTAAGTSYSSPTLTITGGGGSGAAGTATLATGTITSVSLTGAGSGFTSQPTITTPSGGGSGASIVATVGAKTFIEVEPQDSRIDLVMRTSIDLNSLPAVKSFPLSYRVQRTGYNDNSLYIAYNTKGDYAVGMNENSIDNGNGPALAYADEYYMTDSQYEAFDPGPFSVTGKSTSSTLLFAWQDSSGFPHVFTGRTTPIQGGTTAGVVDLSYEQQQYEVRKVRVIRLTQNF